MSVGERVATATKRRIYRLSTRKSGSRRGLQPESLDFAIKRIDAILDRLSIR